MARKFFSYRFKRHLNRQKSLALAGFVGVLLCLTVFLLQPSFPTPDKLFVFALLIGLIFGQAKQVAYRLGPFVVLLLVYESFRGVAHELNERVNFMWMVDVDRWLFAGTLPTTTLQNWWWNGQVQWYDYLFYLPYMLHFVLPFILAFVIWKLREAEYWRCITAFIGISFFAFVVFLLFPAAPPWMASDLGYIEPISRVSSSVWFTLGIEDFPSFYNQISPNPVAAVPSLHAAYATLFAIFVVAFFKTHWRWLAVTYPVLIYVGTVYQGEHYAIDEILGAFLGLAGFVVSPWLSKQIARPVRALSFDKFYKR